jgi:hypothetical protein
MRFIALLGCAALVAGCTTKETPPADTTAAAPAPAAPAPTISLASIAGIWNVTVKPEGKDTVVTTYVLNTTDTTDWHFQFPKGKPIAMKITSMRGDTLVSETDWFDSSVRPGMKTKTNSLTWLQDGKLVGRTTAHYQTTGPDTVRIFITEGTRQQ